MMKVCRIYFLLSSLLFWGYVPLAAKGKSMEKIVLGMGCFWCTEAIFQRINGITSVEVGYAGGTEPSPSYELVCSGTTKYVEVAQITFDTGLLPLEDLLTLFFHMHDPTSLDKQGGDIGYQYKSVIFYTNEAQKKIAEKVLAQMRLEFSTPVVTVIAPLTTYYPAEDYHKNYFNQNQDKPYCKAVIAPKVRKLLEKYGKQIKASY